jgi:ABC-type uncharacterized transport system ATPase subunit
MGSEPVSAAIDTEGVAKAFGETRALDGVDLSVAEGSIFGLLGPNGSGNTMAWLTAIVAVFSTLAVRAYGRKG